jgi:hypothetical protein
MLDLEHLDALDDDAPPEPDLGPVRRRVGRMRARRRWTGAVAAIVVLAGAGAVGAAVRRDDHAVRVAGPTAPTTPAGHPSVSGTLPNGVQITLTLDTPTVPLGSDVKATVVLRNHTGARKILGPDPVFCAIETRPVLRDAAGKLAVDGALGRGCDQPGIPLRADGARTIAVTVPTTAQRGGSYELSLEKAGWSLGPVPVDIVAPEGITARLVLPQTTYPAGYSLEGTVVVNNDTGVPVPYQVDCYRTAPWQVVLAKDGALFEPPPMPTKCVAGSGTVATLPRGETRLPFYLGVGYLGCYGRGGHATSPGMPACVGDPPGTPDLPPGRYQLVFRGTGAPFDSIDVAPLDIDVTARGKSEPPLSLPKIGSDNAAAAQDEFAGLYGMEFAPYRDQLRSLGVDVVDYGAAGNQLVIHVAPSAQTARERDVVLSLFAHPEIVTVEPGLIVPQ